jgi:hypothetical protein
VSSIYYCLTITVLFFWGPLSDERAGLSFLCAAGLCQCSPSRIRVPWDCLRFEVSLFVASYDSQGHGGGIPPRLHTGDGQFQYPYSLISSRRGPRTENTVPLLLRLVDHIENRRHVSNWELKVKVKVTLRVTASQSVSLGVEHPPGTHDQVFITV